MHVFLSPHLDDVVLSCGATVAKLRHQGERVIILTVMAGEPSEPILDTPAVRALRAAPSAVQEAVKQRRLEDEQAATCLGVQVYHLDLLDSAFRTAAAPSGPMALYPTPESQVGPVHPADELKVRLLSTPLPFTEAVTCLYAPLSAGHDVDHQLVRDWALVLSGPSTAPELRFYGEFPAILERPAQESALRYFGAMVPALNLAAETLTVTEVEMTMKLSAISCYMSQVRPNHWDDRATMERKLNDWMRATGGGPSERFWRIIKAAN